MKRLGLAISSLTLAFNLHAELAALSPAGGASVPVQTEEELALASIHTYTGRVEKAKACKKDFNKNKDEKWRTSRAIEFKWRATAGESGPWTIAVSEKPDMSDPVKFHMRHADKKTQGKKKNSPADRTYFAKDHNLKVGTKYYWQVTSLKKKVSSKPAAFKTADTPPRWIGIEGRVENIRDLGGWKTCDGRRVKQGLVFRGQGLNDNSANGAVPGRNRLMVEDRDYLANTLGIKTDLDLRSGRETADMQASPLGENVKFVHHSSEHYQRIFNKAGKKTMAKNFRVFADEKNYPVYFHCIAGADRTGALAFTLLGVLGVSEDDAAIDWEHTFYPWMPELQKGFKKSYWRRAQHLSEGFRKYGDKDSTFKERVELYLLDCGITKDEIERFRSIMLEDAKEAK